MKSNAKILKKQLDNILNNNKFKEGVVISLNGFWGVGKTYFWKKYAKNLQKKLQKTIESKRNKSKEIEEKRSIVKKIGNLIKENKCINDDTSNFINSTILNINDNANVIYISLFGLHSIKDIKSKIFTKMSSRNSYIDKFQKVLGKSKLLGLDLANLVDSLKAEDYKNTIICFDDFERISSNLNIREVLGFISELKEDKECKIVIINNNDTLKEQDKLNIKKITNKETTDSNKIIIQTNNHEIFSTYAEKIIDFNLYYNPSIEDNLNSIKKSLVKSNNLVFVDWELIKENIQKQVPNNKKSNIRYMKKLIYKLFLFNDVSNSRMHETVQNYIVTKVFTKIYNVDIKITFQAQTILTKLDISIDSLYEKEYINKSEFSEKLKKVNENYTRFLTETSEKDEIDSFQKNIFDKLENYHTSDINAEDFVSEIYELLNKNKENLSTIYSFQFITIIKNIKKINSTLDDKLDELEKFVIKRTLDNIEDNPIYESNVIETLELYTDDKEIQRKCNNYLNSIDVNKKKKYSLENIIKTLSNYPQNSGIENIEILENINENKHIEYINQKKSYFKAIIDFINENNRTTGDSFFDKYSISLIKVLLKIYELDNKTYKDKIKHFFQYATHDFNQKSSYGCSLEELKDIQSKLEKFVNN